MTDIRMIDARGPRFAAAITTILLAVTLVMTDSVAAVVLLVIQALVFGTAAFLGMPYHPYGWVFRRIVAPRLPPAKDFEDPAPPRFAQTVGLVFVVAALVGLSFSMTLVAQIAIGFALAAAFLNAVFKFCLGCEMYLLIQRVRGRGTRQPKGAAGAAAVTGEDTPLGDAAGEDVELADAVVEDRAGSDEGVSEVVAHSDETERLDADSVGEAEALSDNEQRVAEDSGEGSSAAEASGEELLAAEDSGEALVAAEETTTVDELRLTDAEQKAFSSTAPANER